MRLYFFSVIAFLHLVAFAFGDTPMMTAEQINAHHALIAQIAGE